jgi:hypothetical protein
MTIPTIRPTTLTNPNHSPTPPLPRAFVSSPRQSFLTTIPKPPGTGWRSTGSSGTSPSSSNRGLIRVGARSWLRTRGGTLRVSTSRCTRLVSFHFQSVLPAVRNLYVFVFRFHLWRTGTIEENLDPKFKVGIIDPSGEPSTSTPTCAHLFSSRSSHHETSLHNIRILLKSDDNKRHQTTRLETK